MQYGRFQGGQDEWKEIVKRQTLILLKKSLPRNRNAPRITSFLYCLSEPGNKPPLGNSDKSGLWPLPQTLANKPRSPLFPLEAGKLPVAWQNEGLSEAQLGGSSTSKTRVIIIWMGRRGTGAQSREKRPGVDPQLGRRGPISGLVLWTLCPYCHESAVSSPLSCAGSAWGHHWMGWWLSKRVPVIARTTVSPGEVPGGLLKGSTRFRVWMEHLDDDVSTPMLFENGRIARRAG